MGYPDRIARETLRQANNDMNTALQVIYVVQRCYCCKVNITQSKPVLLLQSIDYPVHYQNFLMISKN